VQDTDGILERKKKEQGEEEESEKYYQRNGYVSGKIESKRKMDECRAVKGTKTRTNKKEETESKNQSTTAQSRRGV
jgi:outer membrane protein assembly factor BamA